MSQLQIVERPAVTTKVDPELVKLLIETATTGKAVAVPMPNGITNMWNVNVRKAMEDAGLRYRSKHDKAKKIVYCWAEARGEEDVEP